MPTPAKRGVHDATVDFIDDSAIHDEGEDLHPARLDPKEAALGQALDDSARAKRNAHREARDGN